MEAGGSLPVLAPSRSVRLDLECGENGSHLRTAGKMTMSELQPPIDFHHLDASQKLDLIAQIWESLPDSLESVPMPESHQEELDHRIAAADATPDAAIPWEDARARLREKP